jgi:hypothetical protein
MPCRYDPIDNSEQVEASKVLALLEELKTKKLPKYYGDSSFIQKDPIEILNKNVPLLCTEIRKLKDVKSFSPELQVWWNEHQRQDDRRIKYEITEEIRKFNYPLGQLKTSIHNFKQAINDVELEHCEIWQPVKLMDKLNKLEELLKTVTIEVKKVKYVDPEAEDAMEEFCPNGFG